MKKITNLFLTSALAFGSFSGATIAQTLLKDLAPGAHPASSNPEQFRNVNGTMFFLARANSGSTFVHQLWKTDGSAANTVLVKDSLIVSNIGNLVKLVANINDTLFYTLTPPSGGTPQLWKSDGTLAGTVLVTTLPYNSSVGGMPPKNFIVMNNKLYFTFGQTNGRELWVSNGTAAGTMEVINLSTGSSGAIQYPGIEDAPMIVLNNKLYFSGTTGLGDFELFASDGTAGGTTMVYDLRPGAGSADPEKFTLHNNEIYFLASNGSVDNLWKTDGTTTVQLSAGINGGNPVVFKNEVYFTGGFDLWKTNGTAGGTVFITDSITNSGFHGANADYLFSLFTKYLSVPPYIEYHYMRTDGSAAGTQEVSYNLGSSASFNLIDNNMYLVRLDSGSTTGVGLWESDGTAAGTSKLFNGYGTGNAFIFNDTVYFANFTSAVGYEPFYYIPSAVAGIAGHNAKTENVLIYPNPSNGAFNVRTSLNEKDLSIEVYNVAGKKLISQKGSAVIDLSNAPKGIYFVKFSSDNRTFTEKVILQ